MLTSLRLARLIATTVLLTALTSILTQLHAAPSTADYGALPSTSMMSISPSGNIIAFRQTHNDQDTLIVYSLTEKKALRAVDLSTIQPHNIVFTSNNTLVFRVSKYRRLAGYKGAYNFGNAFSLNIENGNLEQLLVPGRQIDVSQINLGAIAGITPDDKYAYMPATLHQKRGNNTYGLLKVNLQDPNKLDVIERGTSTTTRFFIAPSGELLAQERYNKKLKKHTVQRREDGKWVTVFEMENTSEQSIFSGIAPDLESLVTISTNPLTGQNDYELMSLQTGEFTSSPYNQTDKSIEHVFYDLNHVVQGIQYSGFSPSYTLFAPGADTLINKIIAKFPEHSVWISSYTPDWKKIIVLVEGSNYAGEYYLFDQDLNGQLLASQRPKINREDIHPIATYAYQAQDGLIIPTLLTIPRERIEDMKNLPAVILPHGGPQAYDRLHFNWLAQALANQGYLVVQPQFRGSDGFGLEHTLAGRGEWGKKMQSDITDGVNNLIGKGMIDPARTCIVGWSYGGYAALAGGAFTPELYQCVVSIAGVSDIPRMLSSERKEHGSKSSAVRYWNLSIANGNVDKKALKQISPVFYANNFTAPVFLAHGERDKSVKLKQSQVMHRALLKAGKSSELLVLNDDNHHLFEGNTRTQMLEAVIEFVNKHLSPQPHPTEPIQ